MISSFLNNLEAYVLLFLLLFIVYLLSNRTQRLGNWAHLFGHMVYDPEEFYRQVVAFLEEHQVPNFKNRTVIIPQGGPLSPQRMYLEVSRGDYVFHICAAPWGTDFFFSWWLNAPISNFFIFASKIPIIGGLILSAYEHQAYYKLDTDTMFRTSVQQAVLQAIDQVTEAKGIRSLSESERRPDLRSLLKL